MFDILRPIGAAADFLQHGKLQHGKKDQAPLAKSKTTKAKSRSSAGKDTRAAKGARGGKTKGAAAKKAAGSRNTKSAKAGNKQSLRALVKATVKAKPPAKTSSKSSSKGPAAKPVAAKPKAIDSKWLKTILHSLGEMKAEDTVVIDLSDKSSIGETMVVTTGRSNVHLASIADRVVKDLKASGMTGIAVEGLRQGDWVVIDTGGVLVHVFRPEVRAFYAIEKMWSA